MDTTCCIDISEVLGPLWTQDIDRRERKVVLTYDEKQQVALLFDRTWKKFRFAHDVPNDAPLIDIRYMNDWEGYYYGLFLITSCQKPFRDWIESVRDTWLGMGEPPRENSGTPTEWGEQ